ncbi:MAG TPA: hypothetical protein DGB85_08890 [Deltaproteobacteria bacterium]|nr:hypothetical protein [Deltaproteobacteria bacterium]
MYRVAQNQNLVANHFLSRLKTESFAWDQKHIAICSCHPKNCFEQVLNRDFWIGGKNIRT